MASNKLALMRYKIIDQCLRRRNRKWTLDDLVNKVAEELYEREGITSISKRTIQYDIQFMRDEALGYAAPIQVKDKKYYEYSDPNYSITKSPLSHSDLEKMKDAIGLLKYFNGFSHFEEMNDLIARLEANMSLHQNIENISIQIEENNLVHGLKFLPLLLKAIKEKKAILISYQSFKTDQPHKNIYSPYLLKEYRNRWFLIASNNKSKSLLTLALDRIKEVYEIASDVFKPYEGVSFDRYFSDLIGVTKSEKDRAKKVILRVNAKNAPYVETKPLHNSQQVLKREDDGCILIRIDVILNFELEREILGFGETIEVISPLLLRQSIGRRLTRALNKYKNKTPLNEKE